MLIHSNQSERPVTSYRALLVVLLSFVFQALTACGSMDSPETDASTQMRGSRPEASVASPRLVTVGSSLTLSSGAVVSTTPVANATQVRPDTEIALQLDLSEPRFRELANKFQHKAMLVLLNDGGQAIFSTTSDSELHYDAASGKLTLTLPESLERYTTYGVIITSNELPGFLSQDGLGSKRIPKRPDFMVEEVDPESFGHDAQAEAEVARQMEAARTGLTEAQPQEAAASEGIPAEVQARLQQVKALKEQKAPSKLRVPEYVGPRPVRVLEAHRAVSLGEGGMQSGVIKRIEGNTVNSPWMRTPRSTWRAIQARIRWRTCIRATW
jgi:Big-like domain-containing protein